MVPHLTTALAGPLLDLERRILERYAYGVIAPLAQLAASSEIEDLERHAATETLAA